MAPRPEDVAGVRSRNPYLNRVMIRDAADFYGRRREITKIFARIGARRPQSVSIVGDRRIGKSSLLYHLYRPEVRRQSLEDPDTYTFVFFDLQEQRELGISSFFECLFAGFERELGQSRPEGLIADYEAVRRALVRFHEEGRKIILLFDEFDAITRNASFPEEFFAFLRAIANKYDVAYVTTSGKDLQQLCHAERIADSPFFNIFSNLFLTGFELEEAMELIRAPSAAAGVPLEPFAADILDLGGLFPFFLQIACSAYFEHLADGRDPDIDRIRTAFLEEAQPHFNYLRDHLDADQRSVLRYVAEDRPVPPDKAYVLNKLKRDGYVLEQDGRLRLFSSAFTMGMPGGHGAVATLAPPKPGFGEGAPAPRATLGAYPPKPGEVLSHFRILHPLARGGMSLVFVAEDLRLQRLVALKVLPPEMVSDPERKRRFLQEARAASALSHPNIAVVHEVDEVEGVSFIAMEKIDGQTLRERLALGALPLGDLVTIGAQVADALGAAHARGIVHRDVKPENVMLTREGLVKVLDFGIAKLTERVVSEDYATMTQATPVLTAGAVALGTLAYMSPEQVAGEAIDRRSDVFSLGVMLCEMAIGQIPFGGRTSIDTLHAILNDPVPLPRISETTPSLAPILARALDKDRARRYQSMADLAKDLRASIRQAEVVQRGGFRERLRALFQGPVKPDPTTEAGAEKKRV